jgi:hypothetical protein
MAMALNQVLSTTAKENFSGLGPQTVHMEWIVTVPGGQMVTVQWYRYSGSGSATIGARTLFCIQVA